jgi:hypothetical protein
MVSVCVDRADITCVFAGGYHVNQQKTCALEASIELENSSTTRGMNS